MKTKMYTFKKHLTYVLLLVLINISLTVFPQSLVIEQDRTRAGVCPSPESEACVTIIASKLLTLTFESNVDRTIVIASQKVVGKNIEYTLYFPTDRPEYFDRILTIYCQSFAKGATIPLLLGPKESELYYVHVTECYQNHLDKGFSFFKKCAYVDAKEEFRKAQEECADAPPNDDVKNQIMIIDSIEKLKKLAKESYEILDFKKGIEYYAAIASLNKEDEFARQRLIECRYENSRFCQLYLINARNYFDLQEYEKAAILYNKVIENNCGDNIELANVYLEKIEKTKEKKNELSTALTYQWAYKTPFGFSVGGYRDKKVSAFLTLLFNADLFEGFRANYAKAERPEFDASLGITIRPVKNRFVPAWLTIGAGYTSVVNFIEQSLEKPKWNFNHAISPELGILVKIPFGKNPKAGLALRYTFQYRFALDSDAKELVRPLNHIVGLGFCF